MDSKYTLVVVAARRARNIQAANESGENVKNRAKKPVSIALEEIFNDELEFQRGKQGDLK